MPSEYVSQNEEPTIRFGYAASSNISFHGVLDTGITVSQWKEMTEEEKEAVFSEELFQLVEIWDEDPEDY